MTPQQLIEHFETQAKAAQKLKVTKAIVSYWVKHNRIPPKTQRYIQLETRGKLKADQ